MFPTSADGDFRNNPPSSRRPVNKLLATLPVDDYQRIAAHLTTVPLRFKDVVYKQDEVIKHIFFPGGGACSMTKVMQDGRVAEIATVGNEGALGTSLFFGDDRSFSETIVQVAEGHGFSMPADTFVAEMSRRGPFYNRIIRYSQALMSQVMQTTVCNALHSVEQRACRWLLMTFDRLGHNDLHLTHEFMSVMLGVRRPTVTLIVGDLQKAGLIESKRGLIQIANRRGLEEASCECYETVKATFARLLPELEPVS